MCVHNTTRMPTTTKTRPQNEKKIVDKSSYLDHVSDLDIATVAASSKSNQQQQQKIPTITGNKWNDLRTVGQRENERKKSGRKKETREWKVYKKICSVSKGNSKPYRFAQRHIVSLSRSLIILNWNWNWIGFFWRCIHFGILSCDAKHTRTERERTTALIQNYKSGKETTKINTKPKTKGKERSQKRGLVSIMSLNFVYLFKMKKKYGG